MSAIEIVAPGFLTTVQDLGRPGHAAAGVSASGAADAIALRIGNRLVGNQDGAAGLEMTLVGGSFRFEAHAVVAITGADAGAHLGDRAVPPWSPTAVRPGETVVSAAFRGGARAYLCVRGGVDVPHALSSASTHLLTRFGGFQGRALRAGDRVLIGPAGTRAPCGHAVDPTVIPGYRLAEPFRATRGPQAAWFTPEARAMLYTAEWRVAASSDRMGIRVDGPPIVQAAPRQLVTEGVSLGAIQVPADGRPIVLFVEHQTTGGYPKIANVITADLARLGLLRPGDSLRFEEVSVAAAHALLRAQEEALDALFT